MKIIVFGASGSGTTTLGKSLAHRLQWAFFDADDFYWAPTDPPFQQKIPLAERHQQLRLAVERVPNAVVSGSLVSWGDYWNRAFDLGVFLRLPNALRMSRLRQRERERYGTALQTDADLKTQSDAFLDWAAQYDDPAFEGRSLRQHIAWMSKLGCKVVELNGDLTNAERVAGVLEYVK